MADESKELATQLPTDQAILRRYRDTLARTPKDIQPGEAVFINRHGVALGRPRYATPFRS